MIVCVGSGGVGKTTMAAALAVRAASLGRRVLVLTVDPAKRLAQAMGLDLSSDSERVVPLGEGNGVLRAAVIDSKKTFDDFIRTHSASKDLADRLLRNRLYHQLSTSLSGSQEFTSLERLLRGTEEPDVDLVILDTPPTKHALDFLKAPERLAALFQDSVTKWFAVLQEEKGGLISSLLHRGTRTVLKSLETLTGSQFIDELVDFFASIRSVQSALRDRSMAVHQLLTGEQTSFVLVTSFDAAKLTEASYLQGQLKTLGYRLDGVIINRAYPLWLGDESGATQKEDAKLDPDSTRVLNFFDQFRNYYSTRYTIFDQFASRLPSGVQLLRVPEYTQDIYGLSDLQRLAKELP